MPRNEAPQRPARTPARDWEAEATWVRGLIEEKLVSFAEMVGDEMGRGESALRKKFAAEQGKLDAPISALEKAIAEMREHHDFAGVGDTSRKVREALGRLQPRSPIIDIEPEPASKPH